MRQRPVEVEEDGPRAHDAAARAARQRRLDLGGPDGRGRTEVAAEPDGERACVEPGPHAVRRDPAGDEQAQTGKQRPERAEVAGAGQRGGEELHRRCSLRLRGCELLRREPAGDRRDPGGRRGGDESRAGSRTRRRATRRPAARRGTSAASRTVPTATTRPSATSRPIAASTPGVDIVSSTRRQPAAAAARAVASASSASAHRSTGSTRCRASSSITFTPGLSPRARPRAGRTGRRRRTGRRASLRRRRASAPASAEAAGHALGEVDARKRIPGSGRVDDRRRGRRHARLRAVHERDRAAVAERDDDLGRSGRERPRDLAGTVRRRRSPPPPRSRRRRRRPPARMRRARARRRAARAGG